MCQLPGLPSIRPFRDGNGRISGLLPLLLLCKNGFDAGKYISFGDQVNRYRDLYYDALRLASGGRQGRPGS